MPYRTCREIFKPNFESVKRSQFETNLSPRQPRHRQACRKSHATVTTMNLRFMHFAILCSFFHTILVVTGVNSSDTGFKTTNADDSSVSLPPCISIDFTIQFDEIPTDVSYQLVCDGATLWYAEKGSCTTLFAIHHEHTCIKSAISCQFTIWDNPEFGDGLSSPYDYNPGFFVLTVNGSTQMYYDGYASPNNEANYYELVSSPFCVGDSGCGICIPVAMSLDASPAHTGYSLLCGDQLLWNKPINGFCGSQQKGALVANVREHTCILVLLVRDCEIDAVSDSFGTLIRVCMYVCCLVRFCRSFGYRSRFIDLTHPSRLFDRDKIVAPTNDTSRVGWTERGYEFGSCQGCIPLTLQMKYGENPNEFAYQLICDDVYIWEKPPSRFPTLMGRAFQTIRETTYVLSISGIIQLLLARVLVFYFS